MCSEATSSDKSGTRTAGEAGWHASRYNLFSVVPGTELIAIVNLYKGTCGEFTPIQMFLLSEIENLSEHHPIIETFARSGFIVNFDERAALEAKRRAACAMPNESVWLTICPTMACNFDCPYCFEADRHGKMSPEVQDDVVALAERMLDTSHGKRLEITWYGGEPLLALDVIEALSERLMAIAKDRGVTYGAQIVTNGYLLTQDVADTLERCNVTLAQITLDGIGATHDATRHLAGGGPTYERIVSNLRELRLPFTASLRTNVHKGNLSQVDSIRALARKLSDESGNYISCYAKAVLPSVAAEERGRQVELLSGADAVDIGLHGCRRRIPVGDDHQCAAITLWSALVDVQGNLHKCAGLTAAEPQLAYASARDWDPADPVTTAFAPDNLTRFLNWASPVSDEECHECVWLPLCGGGCPYYRLLGNRLCLPFRDEPEQYVLSQYARLTELRRSRIQNGA